MNKIFFSFKNIFLFEYKCCKLNKIKTLKNLLTEILYSVPNSFLKTPVKVIYFKIYQTQISHCLQYLGIQYSQITSDLVWGIWMARTLLELWLHQWSCPHCFPNYLKVKNLSYDELKLVILHGTNDKFKVVKWQV